MLSDCKSRVHNHSRQWIGEALTANFSTAPSQRLRCLDGSTSSAPVMARPTALTKIGIRLSQNDSDFRLTEAGALNLHVGLLTISSFRPRLAYAQVRIFQFRLKRDN